eukprot:5040415-Karenia_brevis.AAC.1
MHENASESFLATRDGEAPQTVHQKPPHCQRLAHRRTSENHQSLSLKPALQASGHDGLPTALQPGENAPGVARGHIGGSKCANTFPKVAEVLRAAEVVGPKQVRLPVGSKC